MFENLQLFAYGAAAVLDLVILLSLLERPNWQYIAVWMLSLTIGVCLWHSGLFVHALLANSRGEMATHALWGSMMTMAAGLLLMPCAMLHGLHRFTQSGMAISVRPRVRLVLYYLPLLLLVPISFSLAVDPRRPFLDLLQQYATPYITLMAGTNMLIAGGLWRLQKRFESPGILSFFRTLAGTLIAITILNLSCLTWGMQIWPSGRAWLQLVVAMSPIAPTLVFAYYVLRFQLLPLVLERTITYGAIVAGALLLHEVLTRDFVDAIQMQYRVNFGFVEAIAAFGLILVYQPLRQRCAEALHYFFESSQQSREDNRRLSIELASRSGQTREELLTWFVGAVESGFRTGYVHATFFHQPDHGEQEIFQTSVAPNLQVEKTRYLHQQMKKADLRFCTLYDAPSRGCLTILQEAGATAAVRIDGSGHSGLLIIGPQIFRRPPGQESLNALTHLTEQLVATLQNGELQAARLEAERRAVQKEKLSSLGLIAGSIAHEIKNPLSSIKSIATVMAEEVGENSPYAEDLRLILGEIDRLAVTTSQLLDIARAPVRPRSDGLLQEAIQQAAQLLSHLARQYHARLTVDVPDDLPAVATDEGALKEIFFNLIANSVEAAGQDGTVNVTCRREDGSILTEVRDNGPGIPPAIRERLFEPLNTSKERGTGFGLYIVSQRVRDCGGEVICQSSPETGTSFIVRLPLFVENQAKS